MAELMKRMELMKQEFNDEWLDRRPHHKLYCSGRRIHEGRAFLKKDLKKRLLLFLEDLFFLLVKKSVLKTT